MAAPAETLNPQIKSYINSFFVTSVGNPSMTFLKVSQAVVDKFKGMSLTQNLLSSDYIKAKLSEDLVKFQAAKELWFNGKPK
jgi:hypothetical protein